MTGFCEPYSKFCESEDSIIIGSCNKCIAGYTLVAGSCVKTIPHCELHNFEGCAICEAGYQETGCGCKAKYCASYQNDGSCAACRNVRFELLSSGLCKPRDCQSFLQSKSWNCTLCESRFYPLNDACVTKDCQFFNNIENVVC